MLVGDCHPSELIILGRMKLSSSNLLSVLGILAADQALAVCSVPETTVAIDSGFSKLSVSNYVVQNVLRFSSAVPVRHFHCCYEDMYVRDMSSLTFICLDRGAN